MTVACNFVAILCCVMYYQGHITRQTLTFETRLKKAIYLLLRTAHKTGRFNLSVRVMDLSAALLSCKLHKYEQQ